MLLMLQCSVSLLFQWVFKITLENKDFSSPHFYSMYSPYGSWHTALKRLSPPPLVVFSNAATRRVYLRISIANSVLSNYIWQHSFERKIPFFTVALFIFVGWQHCLSNSFLGLSLVKVACPLNIVQKVWVSERVSGEVYTKVDALPVLPDLTTQHDFVFSFFCTMMAGSSSKMQNIFICVSSYKYWKDKI